MYDTLVEMEEETRRHGRREEVVVLEVREESRGGGRRNDECHDRANNGRHQQQASIRMRGRREDARQRYFRRK